MPSKEAHQHEPAEDADEDCDHCDHEHGSNLAESVSLVISGAFVGAALLLDGTERLPRAAMIGTAAAAMAAGGWFLLPKAWRASACRSPCCA